MRLRTLIPGATAAIVAMALAGCASANKQASASAATTTSSSMSSMGGMSMGGSGTTPAAVNGVKPVASQVLATAYWQGMKIQARTMTPAPFYLYTGTGYKRVDPTKKTTFHLMVDLDDMHTGEPIPYASVWATIMKGSKVIYDAEQWPMISAYMGPHYGNNVELPGPGTYTLKLLVSPPKVGRHLEYAHVWMNTHTVTESFTWNPST